MIKKSMLLVLGGISLCSIHNGVIASPYMTKSTKLTNDRFDVFVPNLESSNEFSIGGFNLRPGGSNDYAVLVSPLNQSVATPILSPSWEAKGFNPDFKTGFNLIFRHAFMNSGSDVNLYWARLRTSDKNTFYVNRSSSATQQMTGPFWNVGPDAAPTSNANGKLKNKYDVVNLDIAKHVSFAPNLETRFFAGISSVRLENTNQGNFSGVDPILSSYSFSLKTRSKYNALGMRFGMEGEYQGFYNINFVGSLAGNLYIGKSKPRTYTTGAGNILEIGGISENYQYITHKKYTQVVPAVDAKLGVKYSKQFSNEKLFSLELGYMSSIYINAMQSYVPSTYVPGSLGIVSGSVFLQSLIKTTENFSLDGPYVTFSLKT